MRVLLFPAGLILCARAWGLGTGRAAEPGPGLWPAVVGGGLMLCGALPAAKYARSPASSVSGAAPRPAPDARALKGLILGCLLWSALFTSLGWLPATLAAGLIFGRSAGNGWQSTFILVALLIGGLGLGVEHLLRFPLPGGLWDRFFSVLTGRPGGSA